MVSQERLAVPRPAALADGFAQAYGTARGSGSDYFIIVRVGEDERTLRLDADLYLSRTGELLSSFRSYRTGNGRIERAAGGLVSQTVAAVPLRGTLLGRDGERGIVSLGALDGVEAEDSLIIVRPGGLLLNTEEPGYSYAQSEAVGTFTVRRVDALVSEGSIDRSGFFDLISAGDLVVREPPEDATAVAQETPVFPALYRELERIR
jgi:hypothetical protein